MARHRATSPATAACGWPPSPPATRRSGIASLEDTILLSHDPDGRAWRWIAGARRARVEAGALWGDVGARPPPSTASWACTDRPPRWAWSGYTLGGGLGWPAGSHGLAANSVLAIEVVTADGELVRADHETEPRPLLGAARRRGQLRRGHRPRVLALVPLPEVYGGMVAWPADRAREVISAYRDWTARPARRDERLGALPHAAPAARGARAAARHRPIVDVTPVYVGPASPRAPELIRPLAELGEPMVDSSRTDPAPGLSALERRSGGARARASATATCWPSSRPRPPTPSWTSPAPGSGSPLVWSSSVRWAERWRGSRRTADATGALDAEFTYLRRGHRRSPEGGMAPVSAHCRRCERRWGPGSASRRFLNFVDVPAPGGARRSTSDTFARLAAGRRPSTIPTGSSGPTTRWRPSRRGSCHIELATGYASLTVKGGIDLGGTKVQAVVVGPRGKVARRGQAPHPPRGRARRLWPRRSRRR